MKTITNVYATLALVALSAFLFLPTTQALNPPPDGGYPNNNTAEGITALDNLTTGTDNTAIGHRALFENTIGSFNTAIGAAALAANRVGSNNTAIGFQALTNNRSGADNTANGRSALQRLGQGDDNTAMGASALEDLTNGNRNIALGRFAGLGLTTGNNNIYIGSIGVVASESDTIRIGQPKGAGVPSSSRTFIAGIHGVAVPGGAPVSVNAQGQLGTMPSSLRFKKQVKPMGNASEAILALNPVTFRYKENIDPENTPQFGLVAEDVEKVDPDLVVRDKEGKPFSVRYDQVNAMLLNEFLKVHRKIEEHGEKITRQQEQIDALSAAVQKVSARLESNKPAAAMVVNYQRARTESK